MENSISEESVQNTRKQKKRKGANAQKKEEEFVEIITN